MADKQIIELPIASIGDITGDSRFVFQNSNTSPDYQVKMSMLLTYLGNNGIGDFNILGGTTNPDNATGNNRDIYFKANGSVFKKIAGSWVLKVTGTFPAGGTTGQALVKNTNADFDTKWLSLEDVYEQLSNKGIANGYVPLNSSAKVDASYLPSYVSDIVTVDTFADLPDPGTPGFIYITKDTNFEYRWNDGTSAYIRLVASPGTTDALAEGSVNLYYTDARVQAFSDTRYLQLTGGTLTGDLNIGGHTITANGNSGGGFITTSSGGNGSLISNMLTLNGSTIRAVAASLYYSSNLHQFDIPDDLGGGTTELVLMSDGAGHSGSYIRGLRVLKTPVLSDDVVRLGDLSNYGKLSSTNQWTDVNVFSNEISADGGILLTTSTRKANIDWLNQSYHGLLSINTIDADRFWFLPNASGTLALTSDITSSISGTANYIPKFTSANVLGNSSIFDNGTNVGIGTTTPTEKLDVTGNINVSGTGFFSGNVGIGTLLSTSTNFNILRPITGATSANVLRLNGTIQHDATGTVNYMMPIISTEAASFNIGVINGVNVSFGTLGAGSSVTELNGINISSNLTAATNNYGIRSQIPSGTGRWNVYMNGTAQNAMVGLTKFGSTAVPVYNVDIAGTLGATGNVTFSALSTAGVVHNSAAGLLIPGLIVTGDITNNAVTLGKIQNLSTTGRLLGSGSAGASVQEITLGTGLSMSGTTLSGAPLGTTLAAYTISDAYTKTASDAKYGILNATNSWTGINGFSINTGAGGISLSSYPSVFGKLVIGQNYTNGGGETDLFTGIGSSGTVGGLNVYGFTNGGTVTQLLYLNGTSKNLQTFGTITPGVVNHSASTSNNFAQFNQSTGEIEYRSKSDVISDLGISGYIPNPSSPNIGDVLRYDGLTPWASAPSRYVNIITSNTIIAATTVATYDYTYITNSASRLTIDLPASSAVGERIQVIGLGAGGWMIAQSAGDQIITSGASTTLGASGNVTSSVYNNGITLTCVVANTGSGGKYQVTSIIGSPTFN